jgi:hypothetical protein
LRVVPSHWPRDCPDQAVSAAFLGHFHKGRVDVQQDTLAIDGNQAIRPAFDQVGKGRRVGSLRWYRLFGGCHDPQL